MASANTVRGRHKIAETAPRFPYTTKPASLRRFLKEVPKRPKPPKFSKELLRSWGFSDTNDYTIVRVLKALGLLGEQNEPTELYAKFMVMESGARAIAPAIKRVYSPLFEASHTPYAESNEKLQNLFNIHSGGGERALDQQIQTFKALCENAAFDSVPVDVGTNGNSTSVEVAYGKVEGASEGKPVVHINLHIHLPDNKSRRDYEALIEDIGRYIFGNKSGDLRE